MKRLGLILLSGLSAASVVLGLMLLVALYMTHPLATGVLGAFLVGCAAGVANTKKDKTK